jgi:uncharacterized LabA/DUF88 family protein
MNQGHSGSGNGLFLASRQARYGRPAMGSCAVFIDGGYLDKIMYFDHANARLDFEKLANEMAAPDELLRAYYYHCPPYQSNPPTDDERQRFASKHRFFTALKYLPRFEVRLGRLEYRGVNHKGEPIFQQKRVDNMIGVDMAILAGKGRITNVTLLTGDSDYIPSVEAVKREGVLVSLWHGSYSTDTRPHRDLVEICDERREITAEIVARIIRRT